MPRPAPHVRPATPDDLPSLLALGEELRDALLLVDGARSRGTGVTARATLRDRYSEALADPERHVVVVVCGEPDGPEDVLGMGLLVVAPVNALLDQPAVHLSHAVVAGRHRRRGAGRALVSAAAAFAEEQGVEQLVVSVHPGSRDSNRFFARLGFAPMAVRRTAPVAAVRRQLAAGEVRHVDHVGRRPRRPARRARGVLPLGPSTDPDI